MLKLQYAPKTGWWSNSKSSPAAPEAKPSFTKKMFDGQLLIDASTDVVWNLIINPFAIPQWDKQVREVYLPLLPEADSNKPLEELSSEYPIVGSMRSLWMAPLPEGSITAHSDDGGLDEANPLSQMITEWRPEESFGYMTMNRFQYREILVDHHIGLFRLSKCLNGTQVRWQNYIEYTVEALPNSRRARPSGRTGIEQMEKCFKRSLVHLKWMAENGYQQFAL